MSSAFVTCLKVTDQPPPSRWWQALCPAEQERADAFRFSGDRNAYISAHALLRHRLAMETGLGAAELRFVYDELGKPWLVNVPAGPRFNLSHTRGMVAVATATRHAVGVDVEASDRLLSSDTAIAEQHFTSREVSALRHIKNAQSRRALFFWLWTRKEAILKATGKGLSMPLSSFCVLADCDHVENEFQLGGKPSQAVLNSEKLDGFCASVAVLVDQGEQPDFHWEEIAAESVLSLTGS